MCQLLSTICPTSLSGPARRSEVAAILAAGIVRMKSRVAIPVSELINERQELPIACLKVHSESVLTVTNVVRDAYKDRQ
jgi:hypothetical protein